MMNGGKTSYSSLAELQHNIYKTIVFKEAMKTNNVFMFQTSMD